MSNPPLITIPLPITTEFIQKHQQYLFIYGGAARCDSHNGQASVCHPCNNTWDIPTRWSMCKSSGYFNDGQFDDIKWAIDASLEVVKRRSKHEAIIVFPKIGLGASRMKEFAPRAHAYLMEKLREIAYPNTVFVVKDITQLGSNNINTSLL